MSPPRRKALFVTTAISAFVFATGFGFGKKSEPAKPYDPSAGA